MLEFYYFGGVMGDIDNIKDPSNLEKNNFSGVMFTHDIPEGDMFIKAARDIDPNEKIKYLVAIRPYTISPQYLYMMNDSMNKISQGRLQLNLISGYIKDHENGYGGIVGDINDQSTSVERSNYMIEFIRTLNNMQKDRENKVDFYVSTTNEFVFEVVKKYNNKIILPYAKYKMGSWTDPNYNKYQSPNDVFDISEMYVMVAMTPIIRKTKEELEELTEYVQRPIWKKGEAAQTVTDVGYFTYEEFDSFVKQLEGEGIKGLLINAVPSEETSVIIPFIKEYVESRKIQNKEMENQ